MKVFIYLLISISILSPISGNANSYPVNKIIQSSITTIDEVLNYYQCNNKNIHEIKCKMIKRHLKRDTKKCFINPNLVENILEQLIKSATKLENQILIKGANKYLGFIPGKYIYKSYLNNEFLHIDSSLYFYNQNKYTTYELDMFDNVLSDANTKWNDFNPYKQKIKFGIYRSSNSKNAYYKKLRLLDDDSRGPYFINWSMRWTKNIMAHEIGHILGLDDEYQNHPFGGNNTNCDQNSLMCSSRNGKPQDYQYYLVLRRILCQI